jgi:predicted alpha/beta-fold hydrolase
LNYEAPWWLPGGNLQTIWPALFSKAHASTSKINYRRERWATPDADFIDVDFLVSPHTAGAPLVVLFHGLEGSSQSHYARAFAAWCMDRGYASLSRLLRRTQSSAARISLG